MYEHLELTPKGGEILNVCLIKESLCIGGTQRSVSNISRALAEDHTVFTMLYDESIIRYPYGGTLIGLGAPPRKTLIGKVINSLVRSHRQRKYIKQNNIDIAFLFTGIHGYAICEKMPYCKKIISCRDFQGLRDNTRRFAKALEKSDAIVFNSKYQLDYFGKRYPTLSGKAFCVYNIINVPVIEEQAVEIVEPQFEKFIAKHKHVIVSVGRFCAEKGFDHLLNVFANLRSLQSDVGLVIVGSGSKQNEIIEMINTLELNEDIYLTGYQNNPYKYMKRCDVFVLSSRSEGFPNVVPEAMACGLPVVCTNCLTGPAEILNDNCDYKMVANHFALCDYGILTPAFTGEAIIDQNSEKEMLIAINRIFEEQELTVHYKEMSLKRAKDFSVSCAVEAIEKIFARILKKDE